MLGQEVNSWKEKIIAKEDTLVHEESVCTHQSKIRNSIKIAIKSNEVLETKEFQPNTAIKVIWQIRGYRVNGSIRSQLNMGLEYGHIATHNPFPASASLTILTGS
ncbi:hypothetical protein OTU49_007425 [Cherax quadricarinatus]|uniref:Uncharacterized protein n=1 Tax=Cherax quadricarinatus TaxID=27406 RepID=A0AAW0WWQ5_CHEQU